jgi:hypothetical protein
MEQSQSSLDHLAHNMTLLRLIQPLDMQALGPYLAKHESILTQGRRKQRDISDAVQRSVDGVVHEYVRQMVAALAEHELQAGILCRILGIAPIESDGVSPVPDLATQWHRITAAVETLTRRANASEVQRATIHALRAQLEAANLTETSDDGAAAADTVQPRFANVDELAALKRECAELAQRVARMEEKQ